MFRQFRSRPLQSLLIVVAIALGVAVVTAVVAYIQISNRQQAIAKESLAARTLYISSRENDTSDMFSNNPAPVRKIGTAQDKSVTFSIQDLQSAKTAAPSLDFAFTPLSMSYITLQDDDNQEFEVIFKFVSQEYLEAANVQPVSGSLFAPSDFANKEPVILVTPEGAKHFGLTGDPVGQVFKNAQLAGEYRVIGVVPQLDSQLDVYDALIPEGTKLSYWEEEMPLDQLAFAVKDVSKLGQARQELETYARKTWGESVVVSTWSIQELEDRTRLATFFTAIFASLGLLIASLNIMNLFIARVLRRQKEFAILRSLGAERKDIGNKLLGEALVLGASGGVLGVIAGYGLLLAFNSYVQRASGGDWLSVSFSPLAITTGFSLAIVMSLLFSFYPAIMASRVRIREALGE